MHASFILAILAIGTVLGIVIYATIASFCNYTKHDSAPHFLPRPTPPPLTPCEKFALEHVYERCKSCEYGQRNDDLRANVDNEFLYQHNLMEDPRDL